MPTIATYRAATAAFVLALGTAAAGAQTSVSIGIQQPGVYGRIDIGAQPPPPVIYAQPVIAVPMRAQPEPPLYLYVPPGHQKNWRKHCARYDACGRPVYFVQERWVRERYEESHHGRDDKHHGRGKGKGHQHGHDD